MMTTTKGAEIAEKRRYWKQHLKDWAASGAYVFLDGIWLKRSWAGEIKNVSVHVAIGVDSHG